MGLWRILTESDQQNVADDLRDWPAIRGITIGGQRYVRADLSQLNSVWYYDANGQPVQADLSYFGVENMSGVEWVQYNLDEVTNQIAASDLSQESDQSLAMRLLLGEVGDRLVLNKNGLLEGVGVLQTVINRQQFMSLREEERLALGMYDSRSGAPWPKPNWGDGSTDTVHIILAPGQYLGIRSSRALDPLRSPAFSTIPDSAISSMIDTASVASMLVANGRADDITGSNSLRNPIGAIEYRHRCGPPGSNAYGMYTTFCDGDGIENSHAQPYSGPLIFIGLGQYSPEGGFYHTLETGVQIDFVER